MNIGDLVRIRREKGTSVTSACLLYGGDSRCWDDANNLIHTNLQFKFRDIGIVLMKKRMKPNRPIDSCIKVLTQRGVVGWALEKNLEIIK